MYQSAALPFRFLGAYGIATEVLIITLLSVCFILVILNHIRALFV